MGRLFDALKGTETAFPCPKTKKKEDITTGCWGWCGDSDYFYDPKTGEPILYCPLDCMGERELVSGKITRNN